MYKMLNDYFYFFYWSSIRTRGPFLLQPSSPRFFIQSSFALWPNGFNQISDIFLKFPFKSSHFFKANIKVCDLGLHEANPIVYAASTA